MLQRHVVTCVALVAFACANGHAEDAPQLRQMGEAAIRSHHYEEAVNAFCALVRDPKADARSVVCDLNNACRCLVELDRGEEAERLLEEVLAARPNDWRIFEAAAAALACGSHAAELCGEKYVRKARVPDDTGFSLFERDRVRTLRLMEKALPLVGREKNAGERTGFYAYFASLMLFNTASGRPDFQRLRQRTDLAALPEPEPLWKANPVLRLPADADGELLFFQEPASWDTAKSDGERWRWLLGRYLKSQPGNVIAWPVEQVKLLQNQYDVPPLSAALLARVAGEDALPDVYRYDLLGDDETVVRSPQGLARVKLPEEGNFIRLLRDAGRNDAAQKLLAETFEARCQFEKAALCWKSAGAADQAEKLVGNWGQFENLPAQASGKDAFVPFRFRNGTYLTVEARRIDLAGLLNDARAYLKSSPARVNWEKLNLRNPSFDLFQEDLQAKYLGPVTLAWNLDLQPRVNHFDRVVTLPSPLNKPGAYLLTSKLENGNASHAVLWLADLALVKKQMDGKSCVFAADAATGKPLPNTPLNLLGYRMKSESGQVETRELSGTTDANGLCFLSGEPGFQWLISASGDRAYLSFTGLNGTPAAAVGALQPSVLLSIDRPVYAPGDAVKFRFWGKTGRPDAAGGSLAALSGSVEVVLLSGAGEKLASGTFQLDPDGGCAGELALPKDLIPQNCCLAAPNSSRIFQVRELASPCMLKLELPAAVRLGEKIPVTVRVTPESAMGTLHYTVRCVDAAGVDGEPWAWLNPPGESGFTPTRTETPVLDARNCNPSELVLENELPLAQDGTVHFEIATAAPGALCRTPVQRYEIEVKFTDAAGKVWETRGEAHASREPFLAAVTTGARHYASGETVTVALDARTAANTPVAATGTLTLSKIPGNPKTGGNEPKWTFTAADGRAQQSFTAGEPGVYRLEGSFKDAQGRGSHASREFYVRGKQLAEEPHGFNALELLPDKSSYEPGETVKLLINTARAGATVLLFLRPVDGVYPAPKVLQSKGRSTLEEFPLTAADVPGIFVEALTVTDGCVHTETRRIVVAPSANLLKISLGSDAKDHRPGSTAKLTLELSGRRGQPCAGTVALTVFDATLERIAPRLDPPALDAFFRPWSRQHAAQGESNLFNMGRVFNLSQEPAMQLQPALARGRAPALSMPFAFDALPQAVWPQTVYWNPRLAVGANGRAALEVPLPNTAGEWVVRAWACGEDARVGQAELRLRTVR